MAKRRKNQRAKRASKQNIARGSKTSLPKAAEIIAFTEAEEAFFAAGESEPHLEQIMSAQVDAANDEQRQRPSLWRRLFARAA